MERRRSRAGAPAGRRRAGRRPSAPPSARQVALRAPGVVMIPAPSPGRADECRGPARGARPVARHADAGDVGHPRRRRRHPRQGPRPPAAAAGPARLVDRRARDQRHHGRRGRAAEALPRHPDRGRAGRDGRLDQVAAARRRHLGQLLRRPGRPVHHGRGLRGAQAGGRPRRRAAHEARRPTGSPPAAVSPRPASSPGSGSRSAACGPGTTCRSSRRRSSTCRPGFR